jgi:hypothetical protein
MPDDFQYVKMPDGSYGKFNAGVSDDVIRQTITKNFPNAYQSESQMVAARPGQTAPLPPPPGVLGRPAMPGVSSRFAGPQSIALTPAMRASREEALTQPAQGIREIGQGDVRSGVNDLIEGGGKFMLPVGAMTAPFAIGPTLGSTAGGLALGEGANLTGKLLNWSPENTRLATNLASLGGSVLGSLASPSELSETVGRATRVRPTVDNSPTAGTLGRPKTVASLKPGVKALGSIFKVVGGPEVLNAVLPEHPEPTGPFRRIATGPVRPGGIPGRALPAAEVPDVNVIPEPRSPQTGDRPGAMWTIPRGEVPAEAQRGTPGAGDVLRNVGKTVIYKPSGTGYGGARETSPLGQISAGSPQINFMRDSLGVNWAERNGVRVSIPKSIPDAEMQDYAAQKLSEQEAMQSRIH